jgi:adenine-specific DNA methylase
MNEDRRLIEKSLPIEEISFESAKEKSRRVGNISGMHIWWARRPVIASRAAVFASLIKITDEEKKLVELVKQYCTWEGGENEKLVTKVRDTLFKQNNKSHHKTLDCFAGGGAIPLEMIRCGCQTYASDINPVAVLINYCTLYYPQKFGKREEIKNQKTLSNTTQSIGQTMLSKDITKYGKLIYDRVFQEMGQLYNGDNKDKIELAYFWIRTVNCPNPNCGCNIPIIHSLSLQKTGGNNIALKMIIANKGIIFKIVKEKEIDFDVEQGTVKQGSVQCPICKNGVLTSTEIRKLFIEKKVGQKLIAVMEYDKLRKKKQFRLATEKDKSNYESAESKITELCKKYGKEIIPTEKIPRPEAKDTASDAFFVHLQPVIYGFTTWDSLFNKRQLLSLILFSIKIKEIYKELIEQGEDIEYAGAIVSYLALCVDRIADFNSMFCMLNPHGSTRIAHTYGRHAISMIFNYAETNPLNKSAANWDSALEATSNVISNCSLGGTVFVSQSDARKLNYTNEFFDAVIIDPPYYDLVPYSDLSDFFYVWLKRILKDVHPKLFSTPLTPKISEIIQNTTLTRRCRKDISYTNTKNKDQFESGLTESFNEINRVLRKDGILTIAFAHKTTSAWETLISSLLNANFVVTASWPLKTEKPGRLRANCRKRTAKEEGYFNEIKDELKEKIYKKLEEFWKQGIRGADFFISAIGPAIEVFGKYKKVKKLSGEEVTVAELLDEVRKIVTDYSLHQILHDGQLGSIDDMTRFYVLWRWAYGNADVPFDDARKLAQALGAEPDELLSKKGMLNKKGDKVSMFEPWDRKDEYLGEPKHGMPAPMVDVIHRACKLIDKNEDISKFIEESGYAKDESIKKVIQAIAEILPEGDKERRLLQILNNKLSSVSLETDKFKSQTTLESYRGEENES